LKVKYRQRIRAFIDYNIAGEKYSALKFRDPNNCAGTEYKLSAIGQRQIDRSI